MPAKAASRPGSCSTTGAQGRRKALWISKSDKLLEDAQRGLVGPRARNACWSTPLSRFAQGRDIPLTEGILFTTYATLRSRGAGRKKKSRVDQIVDWLGADFDRGDPLRMRATPYGKCGWIEG